MRRVVDALTSTRLTALALRAAALSVVLYLVLRPENFGLTPNGLDPVFYTGYATNLDDLLAAVGQNHYFVTRWSQYLPVYVLSQLFGGVAGRLVFRLMLSCAILTATWRFGRRWKWTLAQELLVGTVLMTMPMFVRAFFTDYTEYAVCAYGLLLIVLCLKAKQTAWSSLVLGVLAALLVVANPLAVTVLAGPLVVACWTGASTTRERLLFVVRVGGAAAVTGLAGLLLFRWHYGLPNVYRPTIDFLRNPPGPDPLRSPRHEWLWKFTWLYGPPILLVSFLGVAHVKRMQLHRTERLAVALCAVQYVYQWLDQFLRHGDGLEISYYWSFMYPVFGVVLVLALARWTSGASARVVVGITVLWCALLLVGVPDAVRLPDGAFFFVLVAAVVGVAAVVATRFTWLSAAVVLGLLGWVQVGAPEYDPSAYHPYNMSPRYDDLFRQAGNASEQELGEILWFERQMDTVPHDAEAFFAPTSGVASGVVAVYGPHVTGRLLSVDDGAAAMLDLARSLSIDGGPVTIAIYGPPQSVAGVVADLLAIDGVGQPLLDVTHDTDLRFRLVVFAGS